MDQECKVEEEKLRTVAQNLRFDVEERDRHFQLNMKKFKDGGLETETWGTGKV